MDGFLQCGCRSTFFWLIYFLTLHLKKLIFSSGIFLWNELSNSLFFFLVMLKIRYCKTAGFLLLKKAMQYKCATQPMLIKAR